MKDAAAQALDGLSLVVELAQVRAERDALLAAAQGVVPLVCGRRQAGVTWDTRAWQTLADVVNACEEMRERAK